MKCPACPETVLVMTERQGIEIDYCPHCRGVWLDRGELDKRVERAAAPPAARPAHPPTVPKDRDGGDDFGTRRPYGGRRGSWLTEIFD